jgi:hypothetical protein
MTWQLVHSEISPLQAAWGGSWRKISGYFTLAAPMTPADVEAFVKASIASEGKVIILDAVLLSEYDETTATDEYYTEITFAPNPGVFAQAASSVTPQILWWPILLAGGLGTIVGWQSKSSVSGGGDSGGSNIMGDMMGMMMPMMMIMMMMPMMQSMGK